MSIFILSQIWTHNFATKHIFHFISFNWFHFVWIILNNRPGSFYTIGGHVKSLNHFISVLIKLPHIKVIRVEMFKVHIIAETFSKCSLLMP